MVPPFRTTLWKEGISPVPGFRRGSNPGAERPSPSIRRVASNPEREILSKRLFRRSGREKSTVAEARVAPPGGAWPREIWERSIWPKPTLRTLRWTSRKPIFRSSAVMRRSRIPGRRREAAKPAAMGKRRRRRTTHRIRKPLLSSPFISPPMAPRYHSGWGESISPAEPGSSPDSRGLQTPQSMGTTLRILSWRERLSRRGRALSGSSTSPSQV